jgi:diacylglycerol kinase (ATP)
MRWTVVVNAAAGRGRSRRRLPRVLDHIAGASGLDDLVTCPTTDPAQARRVAAEAFAAGRGVVACGGDGTVVNLAMVAAESDGVLAIVPTGSGNDFARALGIDGVTAAVDALRHETIRAVDLGRARTADGTTTWFTTVAHTGFDAAANRWANGVRVTGGTPLYVLAVLRTLVTYHRARRVVTVDEERLETDGWLVAVANSAFYGGGMMIAPDASLDDGRLDVCLVGAVGRAGFVRAFPRVFRGRHVTHPRVTMRRGTRVTIESADPDDVGLWAAGEHIGPLPAELTVVAGAVRVVVPRPVTAR